VANVRRLRVATAISGPNATKLLTEGYDVAILVEQHPYMQIPLTTIFCKDIFVKRMLFTMIIHHPDKDYNYPDLTFAYRFVDVSSLFYRLSGKMFFVGK